MCANRMYIQSGIYEQLVDRLSETVRAMESGDRFSHGVHQGPLIDESAVEKAESLIADAVANGA